MLDATEMIKLEAIGNLSNQKLVSYYVSFANQPGFDLEGTVATLDATTPQPTST